MRDVLLRFSRSLIGGWIVGLAFAHMTFALPVKRLRETERLLAFHHPRPGYPLHILLVPKRAIRQLTDLEGDDLQFMGDLVATVRSLVEEFGLEETGYRLVVNGESTRRSGSCIFI